MKYVLLLLLYCVPLAATAGPCAAIKDDFRRLSCFDHAGKCTSIKESRKRLACFDSNHEVLVESISESVSNPASTESASLPVSDSTATTDPVPLAATEQGSTTTIVSDEVANPPAADKKATRDNQAFPLRKSKSGGVEKPTMAATIVDITTDDFGVDYLTLDNDQVWRESSNSKFIFKIGQKIRMRKGFLGSNVLTVEGYRARIKVKRIR